MSCAAEGGLTGAYTDSVSATPHHSAPNWWRGTAVALPPPPSPLCADSTCFNDPGVRAS